MRKLLLISNSTNVGEPYLGWPQNDIKNFLEGTGVKRVLFVPYAGVFLDAESLEKSYDVYEAKVAAVYKKLGYELYSIHKEADPVKAVEEAEAIAVGGGNTFHLVKELHLKGLINLVPKRVNEGMPFMGWSAGSNVACPTLCTTNDMPIVEPPSFSCFNMVPFQINPHYLDAHPEGHGGETREARIEEFLAVNRDKYVAGLREACLIKIEGEKIELVGRHPLRVFKFGQEPIEIPVGEDISFLMK